jgi:hypothetical protein
MYAPYVTPTMELTVAQPPPKPTKPKKHPSARYFNLAAVLYLLAFQLALISIFVPWSEIDQTGSESETSISLWQVCVDTNDHLNTFTCTNIDLDNTSHPAGTSQKCHDYIIATRVVTITATALALLGLIMVAALLKKIWTKTAMSIAGLSLVTEVLALGCAIAAWACWLVFGEENCLGVTSTFIPAWPIQGYTYGFIIMCVASGLLLLGLLVHCVGCASLKKPVYVATPTLSAAPAYPVVSSSYPAYPSYPAANTSPYMAPVYTGY